MVMALARLAFAFRPHALGVLAAVTLLAAFWAVRLPAGAIMVMPTDPAMAEAQRQAAEALGDASVLPIVVLAGPGSRLDGPDGETWLRALNEVLGRIPAKGRQGPALQTPTRDNLSLGPDGRTAVLKVARMPGRSVNVDALNAAFAALAEASGPGPRFRATLLSDEGAADALDAERVPALLLMVVSVLVIGAGLLAYSGSFLYTGLALAAGLIGLVWLLGLWAALGNPIAGSMRLVPALTLALALGHAFPLSRFLMRALAAGHPREQAAREAIERLGPPGVSAVLGCALALLAAAIPPIPLMREIAVFAALGTLLAAPAMFVVLPLFLASLPIDRPLDAGAEPRRRHRPSVTLQRRHQGRARETIAIITAALAVVALFEAAGRGVGPMSAGLDALSAQSPWNEAAEAAARGPGNPRASLTILARTNAQACTRYAVLDTVDRLSWRVANVEGVTAVDSLPQALREAQAQWHDGDPRWREIPREPLAVVQAMATLPRARALFSPRCDTLAVRAYIAAPIGPVLERVADEVNRFAAANQSPDLTFAIAGGPLAGALAERTLIEEHEGTIVLGALTALVALIFFGLGDWRGAPAVLLSGVLILLAIGWTLADRPIGLTPETLPVIMFALILPIDLVAYALMATRDPGVSQDLAWRSLWRREGQALASRALVYVPAFLLWFVSPDRVQAEVGLMIAIAMGVGAAMALVVLPAIVPLLSEALDRRHGRVRPVT